MAAMATAPDFPLQCFVCPRKPHFSDVSHLLTHVASKGHLSQYYKLKLRSSHDEKAMEILQSFDQWYAGNNIEPLVSERMHLKERKRPRPRAAKSQDFQHRAPVEHHGTRFPVAIETGFHSSSHVASTSTSSHSISMTTRRYRPRRYLWSTIRPKVCSVQNLESSSPTPIMSQGPYAAAPVATMWAEDTVHSPILDDDNDSIRGEMTKLKGILWPGMDIFDAASPSMKRKRNQKKDTSVAVQLERHSLLTEPTEMIFTPLGSWRKSRVISGQPDFNSSPDKLSPPILKTRRRRSTRQALGTKDANAALSTANPESPSPFPGYDRAKNNLDPNLGSNMKHDSDADASQKNDLHHSALSSGMRYLTASLNLPPHAGLDNRTLPPSTLLDIHTGALYHNNFFAEALESYHQTFIGLPYYGIGYFEQAPHSQSGFSPYLPTSLSNGKHPSEAYPNDDDSINDEGTISAKSET